MVSAWSLIPGTVTTDLSLKYNTVISFSRETYSRYNQYLDVLPFFRNIYQEGVEIYDIAAQRPDS